MKIKTVSFLNFRNIEDLTLTFSDGVWIIAGENAQGKTNILEGIWYLSSLHSFRAAKDDQLIRYGQKHAKISLIFEENERQREITVDFFAGKGKKISADGRLLQKSREALGLFKSVIFTPDHLMMIKGSPNKRREFLDVAICALSTKYTEYLLHYVKALKNRNRVLKEVPECPSLISTLPVWEEMLARYGSFIAFTRQQYVLKLEAAAQKIYEEISGGREKIKLIYLNAFSKDAIDEETYFKKMIERFEKSREKDLERKSTSFGVHKDDLLLLIGGKSAKFFASQGQIRSLTLSLKLAEAQYTEEQEGKKPIILLDDIFSELDENRQKFIMEHTLDNQCIVTTCEPEKLKSISQNIIFIENGGRKCIST